MRLLACLVFTIPLIARTADAQITKDNYYDYLPAMPKMVGQTGASEALMLYGDRSTETYRDADANGIDDRRQDRLAAIARRFSPILRRNNFSFPRDFRRVVGNDDVLVVDTWHAGRLVSTEEIRLGWSAAAKGSEDVEERRRLAGLIEWSDPMRGEPRYTRPDDYDERVLYVDFPGKNPVTWREAYRNANPSEATVYTHFFIYEDTAATTDRKYQLVAQDWFFYPFNDSGNNHEGDWEHINVMIASRASARADSRGRMSAAEIIGLLDGRRDDVDSLIISAVDYYFHESVITVDYLKARADIGEPSAGRLRRFTVWQDTTYVRRTIRARMTVADGALATHPIGFIGGDNMGPDELLSWKPRLAGGAYNRNGHGMYPFPGIWQEVGPLSSTERIVGRELPKLGPGSSLREIVADTQFVVFADENIILVPDWERVHPLIMTSNSALSDWAWLVLPLRWGFPVSKSPGGGAMAHTDLGNIAPESPTYQQTWNRVGVAVGWKNYQPQVLRVMLAPTKPWDRLRNGNGLLNIPIGLIGFMPGWNVAVTQLMPWVSGTLHLVGAPPRRTFTAPAANLRFSSITAGPVHQFGGSKFAMLLPPDNSEEYSPELLARNLYTSPSDRRNAPANVTRLGLEVHYGPRLSIENTLTYGERTISAVVSDGGGNEVADVSGRMRIRDLTGGARYDLLQSEKGRAQLFARGGYGWTWYKVVDVTINGASTEYEKKGGYQTTLLPSIKWWPNTWYGGVGVELFTRHQGWLVPQVGYGLRLEATGSRHRLGATKPGDENRGIVSRGEVAMSAVIGW